jgi:uncharacterized protein (TIGR03437 family)
VRLRSISVIALCFAGCLGATPNITGVTNAASTLPPSLPSSGVAQGAIFTVFGTGLGPATLQEATSFPLPSTQGLGGTTIQVTVGSVTEICIMLYTVGTQAAAILPSATPVGSGTLTVSFGGASGSIAIQVLKAGFGTFTLNEDGTGPAVVTDSSYNPITMVNAAHPGDTLILWGTGLGAVTGNETEPPMQYNLNSGVQVFVENEPATVLYGGRSSDAGLDQINFTVPTGISGGCKTSIAVLLNGVVGNVTSTSIAQAGQSICGDTYDALTLTNLQKAVSSGTLNLGGIALSRIGTDDDTVSGYFGSYTLSSLIRSYGGVVGPSIGSCVSYSVQGSSLVVTDPTVPSPLTTGSELTITGPNGTKTVADTSPGFYAANLGTSSSVYIAPGTYTVSNGSGGAEVAAFNWSLTLPAPVSVTNLPTTINPAQDLTLTWGGGSVFPVVTISLFAGVPISSTVNSYVEFVCTASGPTGTFTIPSVMLQLLPTNGYGAEAVPGVGIQVGGVLSSSFTGSGAPGLDEGFLTAFTTSGGVAKIQ